MEITDSRGLHGRAVRVRSDPDALPCAHGARALAGDQGLGGLVLTERQVSATYLKDYDTAGEGGPLRWPLDFDVSNWGLIAAHEGENRIGGSSSPSTLRSGDDAGRTTGSRRRLGHPGRRWNSPARASARTFFKPQRPGPRREGAVEIKVETQNINVPACRFYLRQGCILGGINRFAYPDLPDEVQLLWYKDLTRRPGFPRKPDDVN